MPYVTHGVNPAVILIIVFPNMWHFLEQMLLIISRVWQRAGNFRTTLGVLRRGPHPHRMPHVIHLTANTFSSSVLCIQYFGLRTRYAGVPQGYRGVLWGTPGVPWGTPGVFGVHRGYLGVSRGGVKGIEGVP